MTGAWGWRIGVPAAGALLLAAFGLLYEADPRLYHAILVAWGVVPFRFPFLDTHAVLSAVDCARLGFDPYHDDPCDALTRAYNYSPLILEATVLPVTRAWNGAVGVALALMFFVAAASLPAPRRARERWIMALALLSTSCAFAIERGNIDLLIFVLLTVAGHALRGRFAARAVAYALIVATALLKFYPLVVLATALRETPRRLAAVVACVAIVGAAFVWHYGHDLRVTLSLVPDGSYFTDLFGAKNLPLGLGELLTPLPVPPRFLLLGAYALFAVLVFYGVRTALAVSRRVAAMESLQEATFLFMAIGALLIVGCFFAGQNIGYRGIHFLFVLPALLALGRADNAPPVFVRAAVMIVFLMWGEAFREALFHHLDPAGTNNAAQSVKAAFWLLRELVWWRVVGTLGGLLIAFVASTGAARWALGPRAPARLAP